MAGGLKLSDETVVALRCPAGKKDALFFDLTVKGFGVRVTASGLKVFLYQYRVGPKVRRHKLGEFPTTSTAKARKLAEQHRGSVQAGADPVAERKAREAAAAQVEAAARVKRAVDAFTVRRLVETWQVGHLSSRSASYRIEAPRRRLHALGGLADVPAKELERPAVVAMLDAFSAAAANTSSGNFIAPVRDNAAFKDQARLDGQARYRPHFVVKADNVPGIYLAEQLAKWEMARRYGRSQAVTAMVALWRDSAGTLWTPNTLAQVDMPALKLAGRTWLITQAAYLKGEGGTRTMVALMPKEAFQPQPSFYTAFDPQITQAQEASLRAAPGAHSARRAAGSGVRCVRLRRGALRAVCAA